MPRVSVGPIVMEVAGDEFIEAARISSIIWEGVTTVGDTATLVHRGPPDALLWPGRTNDTNTYLGLAGGEKGIHAPNGFKLNQISAGRVIVYLRED